MEQEIPADFSEIRTVETFRQRSGLRSLLVVIRPHQWVKNLFVLAPLLFGRRLTDPAALFDAALGFAAFCLLSSAVYIFNDWWDAEEDRAHPEKRTRPISSGALSAGLALSTGAVLLGAGIGLGLVVGKSFAAICLLYAILMAAYCIWLKRMIVLDAMTIAGGFVLRVLAGAIDGYQRFISPYKGFGCAHRVRTGRASCSQFSKRAIARLGMIAGLLVTLRRFKVCAASTRMLSHAEFRVTAAPPGARAETCPLWSRWGARKLSGCCACWPG